VAGREFRDIREPRLRTFRRAFERAAGAGAFRDGGERGGDAGPDQRLALLVEDANEGAAALAHTKSEGFDMAPERRPVRNLDNLGQIGRFPAPNQLERISGHVAIDSLK
jgi:hypothetical protein